MEELTVSGGSIAAQTPRYVRPPLCSPFKDIDKKKVKAKPEHDGQRPDYIGRVVSGKVFFDKVSFLASQQKHDMDAGLLLLVFSSVSLWRNS